MRSIIQSFVLLLIFSASGFPAHAATPLKSPFSDLAHPLNKVMVAQAVSKIPPQKVVFRMTDAVLNEPDAEVTLRVGETAFADIKEGERYLLVYSWVRKHPQYRDVRIVDPAGPGLVKIRGLNFKAVFADRAESRFLLETARAKPKPDPGRVLAALLALIADGDVRARAIATLELQLHPGLLRAATPEQAAVIEQVIAEPGLDLQLRGWLMQAAGSLPQPLRKGWLLSSARQVIDVSAVQLDLASHRPRLLIIALERVAAEGDAGDLRRVAPLLYSNSPAVVDSAIAALDALAPDTAAPIIAAAALVKAAHPDIQKALSGHAVEPMSQAEAAAILENLRLAPGIIK